MMSKKRTLQALVALHVSLIAAAGPVATRADSLGEILARNIKARGGLERWLSVTSLRVSGIVVQDGNEIAVVQENKRPGMVRTEFTLQGLTAVHAYDGTGGWQAQAVRRAPRRPSTPPATRRRSWRGADIDGPLVDWREKGHRVEYLGHGGRRRHAGAQAPRHAAQRRRAVRLPRPRLLPRDPRSRTSASIRGAEVETETDSAATNRSRGSVLPFSYRGGPEGRVNKQS